MKTIMVTGGLGAAGQAVAKSLAANNRVVIGDLMRDDADAIARELGCLFVECDVTDWQSIQAATQKTVQTYGDITVLINSVGLYDNGPVEDIDPHLAQQVFLVNAVGPLLMTKVVVPGMKQHGGGHIININSIGGITTKNERSVYYGSKWGLTGVTKNLQTELMPHNIKVVDLYPAALEKSMPLNGVSNDRENYLEYQDVVDAIQFILSRKDNVNVTGIALQDINFE